MQPSRVKRTLSRHLLMRNHEAYEQVLKHLSARGDIWMTSQGGYMAWWVEREHATLRMTVADGMCVVDSSLRDVVFEEYPGKFLTEPIVPCAGATFCGEVWLAVHSQLQKKELLADLLRREGILNFRQADEGEFLLTEEDLGPLLDQIEAKLRSRHRLFEDDIRAVRQVVANKLAEQGLPLLRIWYHPKVRGIVVKAVFSPRYDVDRAITNVPRIRMLEQAYGVTSTVYLRAFCPFYSSSDIRAMVAANWGAEIGLHGEFARNARRYGGKAAAAQAERRCLEQLVGRPVAGLCMHGGELTSNVSQDIVAVADQAGFLYDTTSSMGYYFPYRLAIDGGFRRMYLLNHAYGDIKVPPGRDYAQSFYHRVLSKMDEIYVQNGIFVLTLHPTYFGFFSYVSRAETIASFVRFFARPSKRAYDGP